MSDANAKDIVLGALGLAIGIGGYVAAWQHMPWVLAMAFIAGVAIAIAQD
jgi:hypothetical protein